MATRIAVLPDTQVKDDVPTEHLEWAGKYLSEKKPDVIVMIGDWWHDDNQYPNVNDASN